MKLRLILAVLQAAFLCTSVYPQAGRRAEPPQKPAEKCGIHEVIHEDIPAQVAKFKLVSMPFSVTGLSEQERKMVYKLVEASRFLDSIYWRQSDPRALDLYKRLTGCNTVMAQKLRRFLMINGSRYDLLEGNAPFVGSDPFSPGRALYPAGITRQEIEAYVAAHPEKKSQIYSPYTVIKRQGQELIAHLATGRPHRGRSEGSPQQGIGPMGEGLVSGQTSPTDGPHDDPFQRTQTEAQPGANPAFE